MGEGAEQHDDVYGTKAPPALRLQADGPLAAGQSAPVTAPGPGKRRRKRKPRPTPVRASWTIRFAIVALLIVVVLGIVETLVINLLIGPGALRIGIAGILFDLTMLGAIAVLYRRRPFRARDLGLRSAPAGSSVGWVFLSLIVIGITNYLWLQKVLGHKLTRSLGISLHGSTAGLCVAGVSSA